MKAISDDRESGLVELLSSTLSNLVIVLKPDDAKNSVTQGRHSFYISTRHFSVNLSLGVVNKCLQAARRAGLS